MDTSHPRLRVLVVDDEALIRWSIVETLARAGHMVIEAGDATTAVARVSETREPIDVVLVDYRLPDSSDLSLVTTIRRKSPGSAVVLMTAYGTPEVVSGALDLGVHRVLNKPFDLDDIASVILDAHHARHGCC